MNPDKETMICYLCKRRVKEWYFDMCLRCKDFYMYFDYRKKIDGRSKTRFVSYYPCLLKDPTDHV